ncbi:uncharacterized protein [Onthophagus taurus]|uniref:uncharacterized protein n=1 Tax=Onthophagus taurus TaxID=166361 RepID=UPI0039BE2865
MDCFSSFLQIYGSVSSTIKHGLRKIPPINFICKNPILNLFITTLCWLISIIPLIILTIILTLLFFYKSFVKLILKLRHGENFGGILLSADTLWITEDETARNIINVVMVVQLDTSKKDLIEFMQDICRNHLLKTKRLSSIRKFFMGYGYFLANQVLVEDILSVCVDFGDAKTINEENLKEFVSKYSNMALPKDDKAAFEIIICEKRVVFTNTNELDKEQYAVLLRFHHSVADGVSLMSLLSGIVDDKEHYRITSENLNKLDNNEIKRIKNLLFKRDLKRFYNCESYVNTLFAFKDKNPLRINKLTKEKHVSFKIGDNSMIEKVKTIRRAFNCSFSCVLYAAVSQSLCDFFKRNNLNNESNKNINDLTLTFMVIPDRVQLHYNHSELKNLTSIGNIKLSSKNNLTLRGRLEEIIKENEKYLESCDPWIYLWQLKTFCNLLPSPLVRSLAKFSAVTSIGFTNMPGTKQVQLNGQDVSYLLFWVPNFITTGASFSFFTYNDVFQVGFLVDKTLIPKGNDVEMILEDIFSYIDKMYHSFCNQK